MIFKKLDYNDKGEIREMSEFAGGIFYRYYLPQLPEGQPEYMRSRFLSETAIEEKISPEHEPSVNFEFVKDEDEKNVGFVCYWIQKSEDGPDECYLDKYYVHEDFRGKGYGNVIMDHLKIFCQENNLFRIKLNVNKYNKTLEIYKKLGFEILRAEVNDIGNGYVMDDYVMVKGIDLTS